MEDKELNKLSTLIDTIVNYYSFLKEKDDEGEEWKIGTDKDNVSVVPPEINNLVKNVFIKELKKFNEKG
jgi:hypothetical protein